MFGWFKKKPPSEPARSNLVARIKHTNMLAALREMDVPEDQWPLTEPLVGDLLIAYAFDLPRHVSNGIRRQPRSRRAPSEFLLAFSAKRPGMQFSLSPVRFDFDYEKAFEQPLSEAYERLLLDALRGDATLFMPSDELEAAWEFVTPILEAWQKAPADFPNYAAGTWGPAAADRLVADRLVADCCAGGWRQP